MKNEVSRQDYIKELRRWIREMPGWWLWFFACLAAIVIFDVAGLLFAIRGDFTEAMRAWVFSMVPCIIGIVPLMRIFGPYL